MGSNHIIISRNAESGEVTPFMLLQILFSEKSY